MNNKKNKRAKNNKQKIAKEYKMGTVYEKNLEEHNENLEQSLKKSE